MKTKFWKVHSCGNDFIVLSCRPKRSLIPRLTDRHRGIGADGILIVKTDPLRMEVLNADGSSAAMCGNGLRCFMLISRKLKIAERCQKIVTDSGVIEVSQTGSNPFSCGFFLPVQTLSKQLFQVAGVKHQVFFCTPVQPDDSPQSPQAVNMDFVEIINRKRIRVTTWERGVGWTQACGTGACASVFAAWEEGWIDPEVFVFFEHEAVFCTVQKTGVWMEGHAQFVFEGEIDIEQ